MANTSIRVDTVGLGIAWALNETYRVTIDDGFVNQDGGLRLPIAGGNLTTFTTWANPPRISSTSPTHQTTANKGFENISFTIDRANVTVLGGFANLNANTGNTLIKSFTVSNVNTSGNVVTLNIVGNVEANTQYYMTLNANVFLDSDGFKNNAVTNNGTFLFTTPVVPQLDSTSPANATVLAIGQTSANLTFDRPIFYNTGNVYLFKANTNQLIRTYNSSNINIAGNVVNLTLTNSSIEANQKYYFTSNANVVYDATRLKYPGITTANTYNFFAPTAPQLTSTVPTNGTTVSPGFYQAQLVFDRNITANVGNLSLYNSDLSQLVANIAITDPLVSISANVITANLAYKLDSNAHYYITTDANVVIDSLPLKYPGLTSTSAFTFTAPTAPLLVNTYPLTGNVSVYENEAMYFTLDRNAYNNTGNIYLKKTSDNSIVKTLTGTSGITTNNAVVLLDVSGVMNANESYYLTTSANIVQDISGCKYPVTSGNLILFTTTEYFNRDWPIELEPRRLITTTSYSSNTYTLRFRTVNSVTNVISSGSGGTFNWAVSGNTQVSITQGYIGGAGARANIIASDNTTSRARGGGGGGGAGGAGEDISDVTTGANNPSDGGISVISNISGSNVYYAGGGGGGINGVGMSGGLGGTSSGGNGGDSSSTGASGNPGANGIANTGGGGGGAGNYGYQILSQTSYAGGNGASGIVILRYIAGESNVTSATGGTITTNGEYTIHTFTSNANLVISSESSTIVEYLIVGGGGGGGSVGTQSIGGGAGGGAGGLKQGAVATSAGTYPIIVGAGGLGGGTVSGSEGASGNSGQNSSFNSIVATGGGYGGGSSTSSTSGGTGGSGGGSGGGNNTYRAPGSAGATYTQSAIGNCTIVGVAAQVNSHFGNLTITTFPGVTTYTKYYKLINGAGEIDYRRYPLPPPLVPDPYFANVTFLLQGGTNGSTTITDLVSTNPATITSQGSLAWSDAVTKYAATSLSFNGTNQAAYVDYNNTNWDMSGDFTWELWTYSTTTNPNSGYRILLSSSGSGTGGMYMGENDGAYWDFYSSGGNMTSNSGGYQSFTGWVANQWQHHAMTRSGSNFTYWIDGTVRFTFTSSATPVQNGWIWLGADGGSTAGTASGSWWKGYIGGIRFTKGVARYSSTFTPPTAAFPTS